MKRFLSFVRSFFKKRPPNPPPNPLPNGDSSVSEKANPYYSESNGFYWAANHQGMAECVPQHVRHIISNEELEMQSTREQLQTEIDGLVNQQRSDEALKGEYQRKLNRDPKRSSTRERS